MHLQFEDWILSQRIRETSKDLFREAITCYKASAYRAALLFSYLGFQAILRDRIVMSECPTDIASSHWEKIQRGVVDDNKRDSEVYKATQMQNPAPIFSLSEDIRQQVTYWKNRRNDCAHSKRNRIDYSHVESFWLFVQSNLPKFVVRGSKEELLNKIRTHFDHSLTPPGEDFSYIITEIPHAVEPDELAEFFGKVYEILGELRFGPYSMEVSFFNSIFAIEDEAVIGTLVDYLRANEPLLLEILRAHPNRLNCFADDPHFIRNLWYDRLFIDYRGGLSLYCSLLRNELIPEEQLDEANRRIITRYRNEIPEEECFRALRENGFFDDFKEIVFENRLISRFDWANLNSDIVAFYLERFEIDEVIVGAISTTFSVDNHPWTLRDRLNAFFSENEEKKREFLETAQEGLDIPQHLQALNQPVNDS